jgi:hypothetical protein
MPAPLQAHRAHVTMLARNRTSWMRLPQRWTEYFCTAALDVTDMERSRLLRAAKKPSIFW